jgi:hypothetical protein
MDLYQRELSKTKQLTHSLDQQRVLSSHVPIINFCTNSDCPASRIAASYWIEVAGHPLPFEDAEYSSCTHMSSPTRVLIPWDHYLARGMDGQLQHVVHDGMDCIFDTLEEGGVVVSRHSKQVY